MARAKRLTKTKYVCGLQCHRRLWWEVHEPKAPELVPDAALRAVFALGTRVGALAREHVPGGVLVDVPYTQPARRVEATSRAFAEGAAVVYEAAFFADDIFVAVDILSRRTDGGYTLTEVKSSTKVKPEHIPDAGVQTHVARRAGIGVDRIELMHINRDCVYPDLSNLFCRADVTSEVTAMVTEVPHEATRQLAMLAGTLPDVATGDHCRMPYECPFLRRCGAESADDDVTTLHGLRPELREALLAAGCSSIHDVPEGFGLTPVQLRQRRAVQDDRLVVEGDLRSALARLVAPVAYLDFEAVGLAVPQWNGCHPYEGVPAQVSVHREQVDGSVRAEGWIAEGPGDPRPDCASFVAAALEGARTIVAYNASFERRCLGMLARAAPSHRKALNRAAAGLVDLLPIVRDHVYHPSFRGSFSLKSVLPALVPSLGYQDLEIAGGMAASFELERLMFDPVLSSPERQRSRDALLRYCERDTKGLVAVVRRLRELVAP